MDSLASITRHPILTSESRTELTTSMYVSSPMTTAYRKKNWSDGQREHTRLRLHNSLKSAKYEVVQTQTAKTSDRSPVAASHPASKIDEQFTL